MSDMQGKLDTSYMATKWGWDAPYMELLGRARENPDPTQRPIRWPTRPTEPNRIEIMPPSSEPAFLVAPSRPIPKTPVPHALFVSQVPVMTGHSDPIW